MKKQNIWLEAEKVMLMQEKNRIQMLLQDIQKGMDNFHARSPMSNVTTVVTNPAIIPLVENSIQNPPGRCTNFMVVNGLKYGYCYFFIFFFIFDFFFLL